MADYPDHGIYRALYRRRGQPAVLVAVGRIGEFIRGWIRRRIPWQPHPEHAAWLNHAAGVQFSQFADAAKQYFSAEIADERIVHEVWRLRHQCDVVSFRPPELYRPRPGHEHRGPR